MKKLVLASAAALVMGGLAATAVAAQEPRPCQKLISEFTGQCSESEPACVAVRNIGTKTEERLVRLEVKRKIGVLLGDFFYFWGEFEMRMPDDKKYEDKLAKGILDDRKSFSDEQTSYEEACNTLMTAPLGM